MYVNVSKVSPGIYFCVSPDLTQLHVLVLGMGHRKVISMLEKHRCIWHLYLLLRRFKIKKKKQFLILSSSVILLKSTGYHKK